MSKKYKEFPIPEPFLTTTAVALYCHMSDTQIKRWIQNGELKAIQTPGGHYRITQKDFKDFLERLGMPIVEDFFRGEKKKRILIVDDDTEVVDVICDILQSRYDGLEFEKAYDGYEALINTGVFKPDLVILDIRMPKIDGLEVCRRLKANESVSSGIKILAMTAHTESYDRDTVLAAGADEYLIKPVDMITLVKYVEKLI